MKAKCFRSEHKINENVLVLPLGYVVSYQAVKIGGQKVEDEIVQKKRVSADTYSVMLDDVQSFTTYAIRVAGLTRRGEGTYSQPMYQGKKTRFLRNTTNKTNNNLSCVRFERIPK